MKAVGNNIGEIIRIVIGGFRNGGGQDKAAFHIDGGMLLHPKERLFILYRPVGFKISLEAGFLFGLLPFLPQLIELFVTDGTAGRPDNPGTHSQAGFNGKSQAVELFQKFMENLFQSYPANPFPKAADYRMIGGRFTER